MRKQIIILVSCFCVTLINVRAQTPGAVEQVDSVQQRRQFEQSARNFQDGESVPELYPAESSDVGPQSVLRMKPRKTYFEGMADVQYFYTDNMLLTEKDEQDADVLVSTAQLALAPTPYELGGGKFAPRLGYRHQWFDFGLVNSDTLTVFDFNTGRAKQVGLSIFDFNAQTFFTDGRWSRDNWIVEAGFDYTRLMQTADYNEFYKEYVPHWGVQRLFPLNETMAFSLGYEGNYRFTETDTFSPNAADDFNDRTDQILFAAYTLAPCKHAVVQPYYRFKYTNFTSGGDREDVLHSFGVAVYYIVCPGFNVRAFVSYDIKDSTGVGVPDYDRFDAGGGVSATFRF